MESLLQHISHEHPLILCEKGKYDSELLCYGCNQRLSGYAYKCVQCDFILHKSCADLPDKIIYFMHPKHPLTLCAKTSYDGENPICIACDERNWGFSYHCFECKYYFDLRCIFLGKIVDHETHEHSFMLVRPIKFTCDVCGETSTSCLYMCASCQFMCHRKCVPILQPTNTFLDSRENGTLLKDERHSSNEHTPYVGGDTDTLATDHDKIIESVINHFSHEHPLTLSNNMPTNDENGDECYDAVEELCDACVRPLSTPPFYTCIDGCKYFLHISCAQLALKIKSLIHPHPLTLTNKVDSDDAIFECSACQRLCNGFAYVCEPCNFELDVTCALISKNAQLISNGHEHILQIDQTQSFSTCGGCGEANKFRFQCYGCDFNLDFECAALSLSGRHRDEKHPLKLTFVNIEHISGQYFCDLCEEDRDPKKWYYSCKECDLSAHPRCLFGTHNIKYGKRYESSYHRGHSDYFVEKMKNHLRCKTLCKLDRSDLWVFECRTCDYHCHLGYCVDEETRRIEVTPSSIWKD